MTIFILPFICFNILQCEINVKDSLGPLKYESNAMLLMQSKTPADNIIGTLFSCLCYRDAVLQLIGKDKPNHSSCDHKLL